MILTTTEELQIVNYCHRGCTPLMNIMRLPREEAFALAHRLAEQNQNTTAFYRFADFERWCMEKLSGIGLKKGEVVLCDHNPRWEEYAEKTIRRLYEMLGDVAIDIQHIGSTSVKDIKSKPVIDLIVGVKDFEHVLNFTPALEESGFYFISFD